MIFQPKLVRKYTTRSIEVAVYDEASSLYVDPLILNDFLSKFVLDLSILVTEYTIGQLAFSSIQDNLSQRMSSL